MARLSPIQRVTIQASLLNMTSTILAQILRHYKQVGTLSISHLEILPILHFLFWCLASTPPNYLWQELLENNFPGYPTTNTTTTTENGRDSVKGREKEKEKEKEKGNDEKSPTPPKLDIRNTLVKVLLDQTIGAALNNAGFLLCITLVRGGTWADATSTLSHEFWPIMIAAWKIWPAVSAFNFLLVPVDKRIVVGATVGLFWGIYMVLRVS